MSDELVACVPLVRRLAVRMSARLPPGCSLDLVSAGNFALVQAASRYRPESGAPFQAYVLTCARYAMIDEMRAQDHLPRRLRERLRAGTQAAEAHHHVPVSLDAAIDDEDGATVHDQLCDEDQPKVLDTLCHKELIDLLCQAIEELPPRERQIIRASYLQGRLLAAIGEDMGVTECRIWQLRERGLRLLREKLVERMAA